jgi:hypothetical protein
MRFLIVALLAGAVAAACNSAPPAESGRTDLTTTAPAASGTRSEDAARPSPSAPATAVEAKSPNAQETWREVTIPAGTSLPVVLDTAVGSDISHVEEPVRAHLAHAINVGGVTALPEGSIVSGVVTDASQSGKVKGRAHVAVRFDTVSPRGEDQRYRIQTSNVGQTAKSTKKNDAVKVLAPAAGGALIGRIAGGKKGAVIGAAAGAGAGGAYVMSTRGEEVRLGKGTALTLKLAEPLTVRVRS